MNKLREELGQDAHGILGRLDRVAGHIRVGINLVVVTALKGLVAKEVNVLEALLLDVAEAVGLVPASGEDVKRDLTADGEGQGEVREGSLEIGDELLAQTTLQIILFKLVALSVRAVTADGRHVDHTIAELDKGATLLGNIHISNVAQDKVDQLVVLLIADPVDEALFMGSASRFSMMWICYVYYLGGHSFTVLVGGETVLSEAIVKVLQDYNPPRSVALLNLRTHIHTYHRGQAAPPACSDQNHPRSQ